MLTALARVVRTVEAGDKKGNALTFGHRQQPGQGVVGDIFRTARFTGCMEQLTALPRSSSPTAHSRRRRRLPIIFFVRLKLVTLALLKT
jgi:hypothetical protein